MARAFRLNSCGSTVEGRGARLSRPAQVGMWSFSDLEGLPRQGSGDRSHELSSGMEVWWKGAL
jgi:hypothetical protein